MATVTMTARGAPSYLPPPTQNTAPVHEYRCMWTRDAHKKHSNRKYHDGNLKFHTFNSRVMLYDQDRRYIGDLHYRQDEEFGEGLELRLDRGVLVDVYERFGETQTDLDQVVNQRTRDESATKHTSPQAARQLRLTAAASQQKPRPLKDVLRASQGHLGRARIPYKSPYEQRHALADIQPVEPPPKKQKVSPAGKENTPHLVSEGSIVRPATEMRTKTSPSPVEPKAKPAKDDVVVFQEVVDLCSDEETVKPIKAIPSKPKKATTDTWPKERRRQPKAKELSVASNVQAPSPGIMSASSKPTAGSTGTRLREMPDPRGRRATPSDSLPPTPRAARSQPMALSASGRTQLSFLMPKPRPKLMYRCLLPPSMLMPKASLDSQAVPPIPANSSRALAQPKSDAVAAKEKSLAQQLEEFDEQGQSQQGDGSHVPPQPATEVLHQSDEAHQSPLFMSSINVRLSPSPILNLSQDNLEALMFEDADGGNQSDMDEPTSKDHQPDSISNVGKAIGKESPAATTPARQPRPCSLTRSRNALEDGNTAPLPSKTSAVIMPRPPPVQHPTISSKVTPSPRDRPFRRVRSENLASFSQEMADEDFLGLNTQVLGRKHRVMPSPTKLRRTASDSAAIANESDAFSVDSILTTSDVVETGPWTSMEAFLLFEWWPPGKVKPSYSPSTTTELENGRFGIGLQGITTARDMLRDEVHVL